jgi:hypothetical protein
MSILSDIHGKIEAKSNTYETDESRKVRQGQWLQAQEGLRESLETVFDEMLGRAG